MNQFEERHRYPTGSLDLNAILPVLGQVKNCDVVFEGDSQHESFDRLLGCEGSNRAISGDMRDQKMGMVMQGTTELNVMASDPVVKRLAWKWIPPLGSDRPWNVPMLNRGVNAECGHVPGT